MQLGSNLSGLVRADTVIGRSQEPSIQVPVSMGITPVYFALLPLIENNVCVRIYNPKTGANNLTISWIACVAETQPFMLAMSAQMK